MQCFGVASALTISLSLCFVFLTEPVMLMTEGRLEDIACFLVEIWKFEVLRNRML